MCITTNQPDNKSIPNSTTKQHEAVNIQLNRVTCLTYPEKFTRDNGVAPFVLSGVNLMENLGGDDDSACSPKFESLLHIIGHDKTSDTVEDNLY